MTRFADRYELGEILGSGGFATVYRARDRSGGREVAVKVIDPKAASPELADRFRNEALALSRLSSPNIARVYDFGRDELGLFLVMELILGVPLDAIGLGRALDEREVLVAARGLLSALSEAHAQGIVHRDIKPANVLVPNGVSGLHALKVLDFGIARAERRSEILSALGTAETREGHIVGTPAYMAPEQVTMDEVGPASDVWSAGLVLFELLDRGALFLGTTQREQLVARISNDVSLSTRVAEPLRGLLERMLARDPARRFRNGSEALIALGVAMGPSSRDDKHDSDAFARTELKSVPAPPISRRSVAPPKRPELARQLTHLDDDPAIALRQALLALDLSMIDALARRARGSDHGRIARATVLALRLELEAAALVLEPLLAREPLARAIASTLVTPRSNASIARRMEVAPSDDWMDEVEPSLACVLVCVATALAGPERSAWSFGACTHALARARDPHDREVARVAARVASAVGGKEPIQGALADALRSLEERPPRGPLDGFARSLCIGNIAFRADELVAREHLERAMRIAADAGATLLEARSLVSWGAVMLSARLELGLVGLERASTLLVNGEATSLEQMATHNTGAALMIAQRYTDAIPYLRRAQALAREEARVEYEALAGASLAFACMTRGDTKELQAARVDLDSIDAGAISPRARAFLAVVATLHALLRGDVATASREVRVACTFAEEAALAGTDAWLMAEVIDLVLAVARGESVDLLGRAAALEHTAGERGFASFFWFDVLVKVIQHAPDPTLRDALLDPMQRIVVLLGPRS